MMVNLCSFLFFILLVQNALSENLDPADDPKNIERPCPNFDVQCVREYLSKNSQCQIAQGPLPDPVLVKHYIIEFAHANITVDVHNSKFRSFTGNIVEFYINSKTDKAVLAVEVESVNLESTEATFKFNRKAKEPIIRTDNVVCEYGTITFTIVFQSSSNLDLDKAEVYSYIENSRPNFTIGPNITSTSDSVAQKEYQTFLDTLPVDLEITYITQGRMLITNYIQHNICRFEMKSD